MGFAATTRALIIDNTRQPFTDFWAFGLSKDEFDVNHVTRLEFIEVFKDIKVRRCHCAIAPRVWICL